MSHPETPYAPAGEPAAFTPSSQPAFGYAEAPVAPAGPTTGPSRRSGLAVAAFVVGLVALLLSAIPVVNLVSIVGGIVAVILAVVALRKLVPGVTGKGFGVAGLVLGALSVVVATVVWVLVGMAAVDAIESGEFEAALEEAAAAQDVTAVEEEAAEDAVVGEEPAAADAAASDPAAAPAAGPEDFSDVSCDLLAEEAVLVSQETADGQATLVKIRESVVVEDHRTDYAVPAGTDESLVLSCRGTAAWSDTTESPVLTELTIDADGELFVAYMGE